MQLRKIQTLYKTNEAVGYLKYAVVLKESRDVLINISKIRHIEIVEATETAPAHYEIWMTDSTYQDTILTNEEGIKSILRSDNIAEELAMEENFLNGNVPYVQQCGRAKR